MRLLPLALYDRTSRWLIFFALNNFYSFHRNDRCRWWSFNTKCTQTHFQTPPKWNGCGFLTDPHTHLHSHTHSSVGIRSGRWTGGRGQKVICFSFLKRTSLLTPDCTRTCMYNNNRDAHICVSHGSEGRWWPHGRTNYACLMSLGVRGKGSTTHNFPVPEMTASTGPGQSQSRLGATLCVSSVWGHILTIDDGIKNAARRWGRGTGMVHLGGQFYEMLNICSQHKNYHKPQTCVCVRLKTCPQFGPARSGKWICPLMGDLRRISRPLRWGV